MTRKTGNNASECIIYNLMFLLSQKSNSCKLRVGQGIVDIKRKILQKFSMLYAYDKQEQPKLLPGRRPHMQLAERLISQMLKIIT